MNKYIKEQLKKCSLDIEWDENTTHIHIPLKSTTHKLTPSLLDVDKSYEVHIADYIVNEPPNFTLSSNWNNGSVPPENGMYVKVLKYIGKMVNVQGTGINTGIEWAGFLPLKSITIVRCLD